MPSSPAERVVTESVACPLETVPVPIRTPFSKNVTVPVSPDPVLGKTVAVRVTDAPTADGLSEERRPRVVDALVTVTDAARADELARKLALPAYEAVTESIPWGSVVVSMLVSVTPSVVDNTEEPSAV